MRKEHLEAVRRHGEAAYPHECCGFLLGSMGDSANRVEMILSADNRHCASRRNRYLITSEQWRIADEEARRRNLGIIGYYHSHPDSPAVPSDYDLGHSCWPGESYVIVSVRKGSAAEVCSYTKEDYARFEEEEIRIEESEGDVKSCPLLS